MTENKRYICSDTISQGRIYHLILNSDNLFFLSAASLCSRRKNYSVTEYPSGVWPDSSAAWNLSPWGSRQSRCL